MNDRAEECDPPLLAATSAQARPRLQLAEILGPIAGHMIASAAASPVSHCPVPAEEIITVLSSRSLTLLTPALGLPGCGHCGRYDARCQVAALLAGQVWPGDCRLPVVSIQRLHSLQVSSVSSLHRSRSPPSLWPRHTAGHHRTLPCTALYSTVLHCTVISSHTGQRTAHVPTHTQLGLVPAPAPTLHRHNSCACLNQALVQH